MALVINSNIASLQAQKNLSNTQQQQSVTFQRLSTGLRINSAKDDAGGLFLAEAQTKDIRGLNMATRNAGDGISMAQTAEGALDQIGKNLQRVNELAIQSANGSYNDAARGSLQKEVDELTQEINRIVETTEFNGQKLLSKDATQTDLQIGFKNDAGSIIKTGLEGGLVAQGSAAKFTFEGASQTYFNKDQANAAGQLELSKNFLKDSKNPATLIAAPAYTAKTLTQLASGSDTSKEIAEGMKQLGNGESFTVDGMTFSRQQQGHGDTAGQQLKIEFNGNETTVSGAWTAGGVYTPGATISADNMTDLFGTNAVSSANYPLANDYFGTGSANVTGNATTFSVADLKAFDEGLLSALKDGESAELDGVTFTRNKEALDMNSVNGSSVVSIAGVFKANGETGFSSAGSQNFAAAGDINTLFNSSAKEVGTMADLLTGDLSATKVIDISSQASAREAIDFTRDSIDLISELRATFGAVQNRFEAVIAGNDTYTENLSAARSRVQDADFASETANLAKQQVLQQAGVSILGQANATGQSVLGLL